MQKRRVVIANHSLQPVGADGLNTLPAPRDCALHFLSLRQDMFELGRQGQLGFHEREQQRRHNGERKGAHDLSCHAR